MISTTHYHFMKHKISIMYKAVTKIEWYILYTEGLYVGYGFDAYKNHKFI